MPLRLGRPRQSERFELGLGRLRVDGEESPGAARRGAEGGAGWKIRVSTLVSLASETSLLPTTQARPQLFFRCAQPPGKLPEAGRGLPGERGEQRPGVSPRLAAGGCLAEPALPRRQPPGPRRSGAQYPLPRPGLPGSLPLPFLPFCVYWSSSFR